MTLINELHTYKMYSTCYVYMRSMQTLLIAVAHRINYFHEKYWSRRNERHKEHNKHQQHNKCLLINLTITFSTETPLSPLPSLESIL